MNGDWFDPSAGQWNILVRAMLHSLWQAPLLAMLLWCGLRSLPARWAQARYAVGYLCLAGVLVATIATESLIARGGIHPLAVTANVSHPVIETVQGPIRSAPISKASDAAPARHAPRPWTTYAGWGWASGAGLALIRIGVQTLRAGRFADHGSPVFDEAILRLVAQLATRVGIRRAVRVVSSVEWSVPGVVGIIWPTILLPASMISGVPAEQLAVILAHELAHVRRCDYLLNIWQQLAEALLFFNPAVWWIGRQIRREREACCDAMAVSVTGDASETARTLATFADGLLRRRVPPMMAINGGTSGAMLDRIRRILRPDDRPAAALPWYSMIVALASGLVMLAVLGSGVNVAVAEARRLLTPTERVDEIAAIQRDITPSDDSISKPAETCEIHGVVRTANGERLPHTVQVWLLHASRHAMKSYGVDLDSAGHFSTKIPPGEVNLSAIASDFAPAFAGPITVTAAGKAAAIKMVLDRGFTTTLHIVNASGSPLAAAEVDAQFTRNFSVGGRKGQSDAAGAFTIEHATTAAPLNVQVTLDGFQVERQQFQLNPKSPATIRMAAADRTSAIVTDAITGLPLPNATIRLADDDSWNGAFRSRNAYWLHDASRPPPVLAKTDAAGRFTLNTLRDDGVYALYVNANDHGTEAFTGIRAGQRDIALKLGPRRILRGEIIGDLRRLPQTEGKPMLAASLDEVLNLESMSSFSHGIKIPVTVDNGVGTFEFDDIGPATIELDPPGLPPIRFDKDQIPPPLRIDLNATPATTPAVAEREVVFQFSVLAGAPAPLGSLRVFQLTGTPPVYMPADVPIIGGVARFRSSVPGKLGYNGQALAGYWTEEKLGIDIAAGDEPAVIQVPVEPAGAARGRVLEPDGTPCRTFSVSDVVIRPSDSINGRNFTLQPFNGNPGDGPAGAFLLTPIPLGGLHRFVASAQDRYAMSDQFEIDEATPIRDVTLQLKPGNPLPVHILAPDGQPAAGVTIRLELNVDNHGFSGCEHATDRNGDYTFEHISEIAGGSYRVIVLAGPDYPGRSISAPLDGSTIAILLPAGRALSGEVLNDATGKPIAAAEVDARPTGGHETLGLESVKAIADSDGRFAFHNLADADYQLAVVNTAPAGAIIRQTPAGRSITYSNGSFQHVHPGQSVPMTLRVQPLDSH